MIRVKFWGATGSLPSRPTQHQIKEKMIRAILAGGENSVKTLEEAEAVFDSIPYHQKYGLLGNTSCVEIQGLGDYFVIDAGSGIRNCGIDILKRQEENRSVHLFLSHFHWDHIMGFPFFLPAFHPEFSINIYSGHPEPDTRLKNQQVSEHFPVDMTDMPSFKQFFQLSHEKQFSLNGIKVSIQPLRHPGGSYAYRFDFRDGKSLVYATDGEYPTRELGEEKFDEYVQFCKDADLIIFDAQYSFHEAEISKADWGHSSPNIGVELAIEAEAKHVVFYHHDPASTDEELNQKLIGGRQYAKSYCQNYSKSECPKISLAIEEGVIDL